MHFCTKHKALLYFFSKCATWIKLQKKNAAIRSTVQYSGRPVQNVLSFLFVFM